MHVCQKSGNNHLPRISPPSQHHLPGEQCSAEQCTAGCGRLEAEELEAMMTRRRPDQTWAPVYYGSQCLFSDNTDLSSDLPAQPCLASRLLICPGRARWLPQKLNKFSPIDQIPTIQPLTAQTRALVSRTLIGSSGARSQLSANGSRRHIVTRFYQFALLRRSMSGHSYHRFTRRCSSNFTQFQKPMIRKWLVKWSWSLSDDHWCKIL